MNDRIEKIISKLKDKNIKCNTVVKLDKIKEFENNNNVVLPNEIVLFYTMISNGCEMIDGCKLYSFEEWKYNKNTISKEFDFLNYFIWEEITISQSELDKIEYGNIEVIDIGDSQTWNIIVSGNQYGKMWFFTDIGIQPAAPTLNFLDWFEYWLNGGEDYFI